MTNTISNVPRELLRDIETHLDNIAEFDPTYAPYTVPLNTSAELLIPLRALLSAPSPAGVDGLETICVTQGGCNVSWTATKVLSPAGTALCRLSDAQAIIDGLRGEVADLGSMLATVSKAGLRVRTERDQQAQRIGELEGLLRESGKTIHKLQAEQPTPARIARYLDAMRAEIDAALSAGKEWE